MVNFGAALDEELDLPKCDKCDRGPFDDSRKRLGNRYALSGFIAGGASAVSQIPMVVDGFSITTGQLAKAARKAGNDELADNLDKASDLTDAKEYIKKAGDEIFGEFDWDQEGDKNLCYDCK